MFGLFKKRSSIPTASDLDQMTSTACEAVKEKWIHFHQTVHLQTEVPLSRKIDIFAEPIQLFFQNKYPALLIGSTELFWLTIFTAILESGTHPKEEINAAIAQLRSKYSASQRDHNPIIDAFQLFVAETKNCASEMLKNGTYIMRELPTVTISDDLRELTTTTCSSIISTGLEATFLNPEDDGGKTTLQTEQILTHISRVLPLLSKDLSTLHGLVMALQAQSELDKRFVLASLLVGESATNILQSYTRAWDAADSVKTICTATART